MSCVYDFAYIHKRLKEIEQEQSSETLPPEKAPQPEVPDDLDYTYFG